MSRPELSILHVIHDFLPRHRAGSEIYAFELGRQQARRHRAHVLCAEYDPSRPHGSLSWRVHGGLSVVELVNNWAFSTFAETYRSPRINGQIEHVLRAVQPDVLHIHNLLTLSLDVPALARARGIPSVATLHDYTLVCPSGGQRVHLAEEHLCDVIDADRCRRCFLQSPFHSQMVFARLTSRTGGAKAATRVAQALRRRFPGVLARVGEVLARAPGGPPVTAEDIRRRLEAARQVFDTVDLFVAPSAALAAEFRRLGMPAEKIQVSDYGFAPFWPAPRPPGEGPLQIGFVGTLVWHKGVHVLLEAARELPRDRFELRLFGDPGTFPGYVASLREQAQDLPARFMGAFRSEQAPAIYGQIDVLVVPSLWYENSPLVIHEAFLAGVPVVGSRQGGIPGLVEHGRNGLLYEAFSPIDLARALRTLIDEPATLRRLAAALPRVKPIEQDAQEWDATYRKVLESRRPALPAAR